MELIPKTKVRTTPRRYGSLSTTLRRGASRANGETVMRVELTRSDVEAPDDGFVARITLSELRELVRYGEEVEARWSHPHPGRRWEIDERCEVAALTVAGEPAIYRGRVERVLPSGDVAVVFDGNQIEATQTIPAARLRRPGELTEALEEVRS